MPDMDPIAPWLRKTVTDFDRANAPVEEVKKELVEEVTKFDPAAPKVETPAQPVKVEEKVTPLPPVAEVAPEVNNAPASTVPPAIATPAPAATPAPTVPPVATQSPTQPLK
jgi:hypothetical protein